MFPNWVVDWPMNYSLKIWRMLLLWEQCLHLLGGSLRAHPQLDSCLPWVPPWWEFEGAQTLNLHIHLQMYETSLLCPYFKKLAQKSCHLLIFSFNIYCLYVFLYTIQMCGSHWGQKRVLVSWNWCYRWMWVVMWVLGVMDLMSSARAASAVNHQAISPDPSVSS